MASVPVGQTIAGVRVSLFGRHDPSIGAKLQLSAAATAANGHACLGYKFDWSSSDENVASVGQHRSVGNGRTRIAAASDAWADSADITAAKTATRIRLALPPDTP